MSCKLYEDKGHKNGDLRLYLFCTERPVTEIICLKHGIFILTVKDVKWANNLSLIVLDVQMVLANECVSTGEWALGGSLYSWFNRILVLIDPG